jgi:small subunit ribosomal protein S2
MSTYEVDLKDLLEAGSHFGHQARRWNPKMKKFIYAERDGVHIFDLLQTGPLLETAMEQLRDMVRAGKEVVFVGAKRQAKAIVREEATKAGAPYVTERWLGGMLTNWEEMEKRLKKLSRLKKQREAGELAKKYTKLEQSRIDKEIERLDRFFGGIETLTKRPDALFIVDTHREKTAVYEAGKVGATVFGMIDSNADPEGVDYPIPANDDAVRSIKLVVEKMAGAYADGKLMKAKEEVSVKSEVKSDKSEDQKNNSLPAESAGISLKKGEAEKVAEKPKVKKVLKPTDTKKKATKKKVVATKSKKK